MTLFYYAGHGLQAQGENFLVPVDADIRAEDEIPDLTVSLSRIEQRLSDAKPRLALFILDACRNNPFESQMRSYAQSRDIPVNLERGLSNRHIRFATQSLIAYATAPGEVAQDNPQEDHGIYTKHLLKYLTQPGLSVEHVFKRTAKDVTTSTAYAQQPWVHGNLFDEFYFTPKPQAPKPPEPPRQEPPKQPNTPATFRLTLRPKPVDAVVTLKEVPNYYDGIALKPGRYTYTVSHEHCEPYEGTVHLQRDIEIPVTLKCQGSKVPYLSIAAVVLLLAGGGWYASRGENPPIPPKEKKEVTTQPEKAVTAAQTTNGGVSPTLQPAEKTVQTPPEPTTFSLTVRPTPSDASIYIMNIVPGYQDGMKLEMGEYDLKVVKNGYKTYQETITLTSNLTHPVTLEALPDPVARITANVEAEVYVDGTYKGRSPLTLRLKRDVGYRVTLKKEKYDDVAKTVKLDDDETFSFNLPSAFADVTIRTKPVGASLAVDGESVGVTPFTGELRKGSHTLKMTLKTYYDKTRTIEVDRAGTFEYAMKAKPKPTPKYTGKWNPAIYRGKRSYHRNTSGTVKDNYTGLIWQKGRSSAKMTWSSAASYCRDLSLDGYSDWRLPTKRELYYLADRTRRDPAVDTAYFDENGNWYWSASEYKNNSSGAWLVRFGHGSDNWIGKSDKDYVRCVRE